MNRVLRHIPSSLVVPLLAAVVAACGGGAGESGPDTTAYLERLGSDTVAIEIVRRYPGRVEGEVIARTPLTRYMTYSFEVDATGTITRFETDQTTPAGNTRGPGRWYASMEFADGRAVIAREAEGVADTVSLAAAPGTVPTIGRIPMPLGILEQALRSRDLAGGGAATFDVLSPWGMNPGSTPTRVTARGGSEVELDFFGSPMIISLDGEDRIVGLSGAETTMKVEVEPIDEPDMGALAADYATRDMEGTGLGTPSPPAAVEATVGGANLLVEYSRPSKRGREIWGALVPFGEVWRTGANSATHFVTDRPVTIGDLELPAGAYTLWTTFSPEGGTLIVNRQTRIWGTAYDAAFDLGRTPLESTVLDAPVEQFTIAIESDGDGGVLSLAWDDRRFSAPVSVR